jgi:sodium pump decarboxylase gamma subunit
MGTLQFGIISHNVAVLAEQSMSEKLKTGLLNLVLGMGTVFIILIIIILLLSLFKFIPYLQNKMTGNAKEIKNNNVDQVIAQITQQEEEEIKDDYELIAVITAAVYASLGEAVPADGLIVRSIRKVNSRRRMNA